MSFRRIAIGAGLAGAMLLAAVPAMAADTDPEHFEERLDRACARIPNITSRVENALARINGDAATRGSIAWLEVRQAEAQENGRDQLADLIDIRIDIRTERIDVLELRLDFLAEAAEACEARG
ncbi:MAG TPA: hypothetical protein VIH55_03210 [Acidimicrobiia bacterium]